MQVKGRMLQELLQAIQADLGKAEKSVQDLLAIPIRAVSFSSSSSSTSYVTSPNDADEDEDVEWDDVDN